MASHFFAQYAKRNNSSCKRCKGGITKRAIRFGTMEDLDWNPTWYHYQCLPPGLAWRLTYNGKYPCIVCGLSEFDQQRVLKKVENLIQQAQESTPCPCPQAKAPQGHTGKRSAEQMTREAEEKLRKDQKRIRLLEDQVENRKIVEFKINEKSHQKFLEEMKRKKKDVWKVDKVSTEHATADGIHALLNNACFWNDLPIPEKPDLEPTAEGANKKPAAQKETRTCNKTEAKQRFHLRDADLEVIPYTLLPNTFYGGANVRSYNYGDLSAYSKQRDQQVEYELALKGQKVFCKRMDDLQKALASRGFAYLNFMMETSPDLLQVATEGYTNVEWNPGRKHPLTATNCAKRVLMVVPFFQICSPPNWQVRSVVDHFCAVQYNRLTNVYHATRQPDYYEAISRKDIVQWLVKSMDNTKALMEAFRHSGPTIKSFLNESSRQILDGLFEELNERDIVKYFD